jgi:uncharacterized membrane protein
MKALHEFIKSTFIGGLLIVLPVGLLAMVLISVCLGAGLLARTRTGQHAGRFFERTVLNRVPGYTLVRSVVRSMANLDDNEQFVPAFVEMDDALVPAYVVESHADGRYTVLVPSAPTPSAGAIYVMPGERIRLVDAPLLSTIHVVKEFGIGSAALLEKMRAPGTAT